VTVEVIYHLSAKFLLEGSFGLKEIDFVTLFFTGVTTAIYFAAVRENYYCVTAISLILANFSSELPWQPFLSFEQNYVRHIGRSDTVR